MSKVQIICCRCCCCWCFYCYYFCRSNVYVCHRYYLRVSARARCMTLAPHTSVTWLTIFLNLIMSSRTFYWRISFVCFFSSSHDVPFRFVALLLRKEVLLSHSIKIPYHFIFNQTQLIFSLSSCVAPSTPNTHTHTLTYWLIFLGLFFLLWHLYFSSSNPNHVYICRKFPIWR